jgi:hypothetical protein
LSHPPGVTGLKFRLGFNILFQIAPLSFQLASVLKINSTQHIYLHQGLIFFCLILLSATSALSAEAKISDLVIRESQGKLLVDFKIENFFTQEMQAAVLKGIPITISLLISFYEVLDVWFDNKLVEKKEFQSIHYDAIKKEYRIQRSWEKRAPSEEKDFLKAQNLLSEIKGLDIISLLKLKKGAHYQLEVQSELYDRYLPFSGTPFGFKTDWYTVSFIY